MRPRVYSGGSDREVIRGESSRGSDGTIGSLLTRGSSKSLPLSIAHKKHGRKSFKAQIARSIPDVDSNSFVTAPRHEEDNGWQVRCEEVSGRFGMLFNSYTMSDVTFQVEDHKFPAHKFIVAAASPVLHKAFFQEPPRPSRPSFTRSGSFASEGGRSVMSGAFDIPYGHTVYQVYGVSYFAFFEFLKFLYTDSLNITKDTVLSLLCLADTYQVAGLSEECFDFLRAEIEPGTVLRMSQILDHLLEKSIMTGWRDAVVRKKTERNAKETASISVMSEGTRSGAAGYMSESMSLADFDDGTSEADDDDYVNAFWMSPASVSSKKKSGTVSGFRGTMLKTKVTQIVAALLRTCSKCIQQHTGAVISSPDFLDIDGITLRNLLSIDNCDVSEIVLFRACLDWADKCCRTNGFKVKDQNRRKFLGQKTLSLIRFPAMTVDEFQWEVVPSGLLDFQDVQSLLQAMTYRGSSFGSAFINVPRCMKMSRNKEKCGTEYMERPSLVADKLYAAVEEDPLDRMLGAELLRVFLQQSSDDKAALSLHPDANEGWLLASNGRTFNSPSLVRKNCMSDRMPLPPETPRPSGRGQRHVMVMGSRRDSEKQEQGSFFRGGGIVATPADFVRIAPGFYIFRNVELIELWLMDGEATVTNYGQHGCGPLDLKFPTLPVDAETARSRLGIPVGRAQEKGGVPLAAFLCRQ